MKVLLILAVFLAVLLAILTPIEAESSTVLVTRATTEDPNARYFSETNIWLVNTLPDGTPTKFYSTWKATGGLAINGYPIEGAKIERGQIVQYTERTRFELGKDGQVTRGLLGVENLAGVRTVTVEVERAVEVDRQSTLDALQAAKAENDKYENSVIPALLGELNKSRSSPDFGVALFKYADWSELIENQLLAGQYADALRSVKALRASEDSPTLPPQFRKGG